MARLKKPKTIDVQKFGGVDDLGTIREEGNFDAFKSGMTGSEQVASNVNWEGKSVETQSQTHLEDDEGSGNAAVIRKFTFAANPESFAQYKPTKQELFNAHYKGIETALWVDGLKVIPESNPEVVIAEDGMSYSIFVGARPQKGHSLPWDLTPQTLKEIAHG